MTKIIPIILYTLLFVFIAALMYIYPPSSVLGWFAFGTGAIVSILLLVKGTIDLGMFMIKEVPASAVDIKQD